jgi:hypothetical protein
MAEELNQSEPATVLTDAQDICRAYSNHILITWNAFDVRMNFGDFTAIPNPKDGKFHVETKAVVSVSWTQAKQIAELLAEVVRRYEAANGEIKRVTDIKPS